MKPHFSSQASSLLLSLCAGGLVLSLAACGKKDDGKTIGQSVESGMAKTEQMAKDQTPASPTVAKMADKLDDAAITAAVSTVLAKDPDLSAIKIDVDTKNGVVTLNGPAPTAGAKTKAADIAGKIQGVTSVNNQLVIKPS